MTDLAWEIDDGPEDPDDERDDWRDEDYYDDDDFGPPQEEPGCFRCYGSGIERTRCRERRCRECRPSRLRVWWWGTRWRLRTWRPWRRRPAADDPWGPPF